MSFSMESYVIWIVYIKTEDIYADFAKDVEAIFDTFNYELDGLLTKGKNKKVIGLMKDKLGEKNERIRCIKRKNTQLFNRQQ